MKTTRLTIMTLSAAALMLFSSTGWTADDDAEATIRLMGEAEAELPLAVTKQITIPTHLMQASQEVQQHAVEKSEKGLEKASERNERRERGQMQAEDVRERGAEMSERANEHRANKGRSEDRPEPPEEPPGPSDQ